MVSRVWWSAKARFSCEHDATNGRVAGAASSAAQMASRTIVELSSELACRARREGVRVIHYGCLSSLQRTIEPARDPHGSRRIPRRERRTRASSTGSRGPPATYGSAKAHRNESGTLRPWRPPTVDSECRRAGPQCCFKVHQASCGSAKPHGKRRWCRAGGVLVSDVLGTTPGRRKGRAAGDALPFERMRHHARWQHGAHASARAVQHALAGTMYRQQGRDHAARAALQARLSSEKRDTRSCVAGGVFESRRVFVRVSGVFDGQGYIESWLGLRESEVTSRIRGDVENPR